MVMIISGRLGDIPYTSLLEAFTAERFFNGSMNTNATFTTIYKYETLGLIHLSLQMHNLPLMGCHTKGREGNSVHIERLEHHS